MWAERRGQRRRCEINSVSFQSSVLQILSVLLFPGSSHFIFFLNMKLWNRHHSRENYFFLFHSLTASLPHVQKAFFILSFFILLSHSASSLVMHICEDTYRGANTRGHEHPSPLTGAMRSPLVSYWPKTFISSTGFNGTDKNTHTCFLTVTQLLLLFHFFSLDNLKSVLITTLWLLSSHWPQDFLLYAGLVTLQISPSLDLCINHCVTSYCFCFVASFPQDNSWYFNNRKTIFMCHLLHSVLWLNNYQPAVLAIQITFLQIRWATW